MTTAIVPLDPTSPRGIEVAEALTQIFAEVRLAIWRRSQSKPAKPGSPAPSTPPRPKSKPKSKPVQPKKGRAA